MADLKIEDADLKIEDIETLERLSLDEMEQVVGGVDISAVKPLGDRVFILEKPSME